MKGIAIAVALAATGVSAQQGDAASGSYGQSDQARSGNSAQSRIGGRLAHSPERAPGVKGRVRAGYDLGVASGLTGGRTDTGPVGDLGARNLDRLPAPQPPSLAQPTREEIVAQQRNGRIRDRDLPDRIRAQYLSELDIPSPDKVRQVAAHPYRARDTE